MEEFNKQPYTPPTKAELDGFIQACDVDAIRELHEAAKQAVKDLEDQFADLTMEQHELSRQVIQIDTEYNLAMEPIIRKRIRIKEDKNRLDVMTREHKLNTSTIYSAMFAAIDRKKQQPR